LEAELANQLLIADAFSLQTSVALEAKGYMRYLGACQEQREKERNL
jgi:hypothetical protein